MHSLTRRLSKRAVVIATVVATVALAMPGPSSAGPASRPELSVARSAGNVSGTTDAQGRNGTRLHFNVRFSPFTLIDVDHSGPRDISDGDEIVFHDRLLRHGHRIGDEGGSCVVVDGEAALANCTGVIRLPRGLISFQFLNEPPPEKTFVITGGTGRFLDVGGTGHLHEDATGPTGTLTLRLVRGSDRGR